MPPMPNFPYTNQPRVDTWYEKLTFGLATAVLGGIVGYSLGKYENSSFGERPSAGATATATDTDTLTMPKVIKTDWEMCDVDGRKALVGVIEIDGSRQGIMLLADDRALRQVAEKEYRQIAQLADKDLAITVLQALADNPVNGVGRFPIRYQDGNGDLKSMKLDRDGGVVDVAPTKGIAFFPTLEGFPLYTVTTEVADVLRKAEKKVDTTASPAIQEQATAEKPLTAEEVLDRLAIEVAVKSAGFKDFEDFKRQMHAVGLGGAGFKSFEDFKRHYDLP